MRIAIILSFPSSNILILFVYAVGQRIETPPFPFGNLNPSSVSFVSEHLVKLSIEGNRNLISYFLNSQIKCSCKHFMEFPRFNDCKNKIFVFSPILQVTISMSFCFFPRSICCLGAMFGGSLAENGDVDPYSYSLRSVSDCLLVF